MKKNVKKIWFSKLPLNVPKRAIVQSADRSGYALRSDWPSRQATGRDRKTSLTSTRIYGRYIWRIRPKESHHQIRDKQTFPMVPDMIRKRPIMIANGVTQKVINIDLQGIKWPFSRQISTFLFDKWNKEMFLHTQDYCLRHLKLWKVSFCVLFVPSRSMQVQPSYSQLEGGGS